MLKRIDNFLFLIICAVYIGYICWQGYLLNNVEFVSVNIDESLAADSSHVEITAIPYPQNVNAEKVALGENLFFDTRLSKDNTVSCGSCHNLMQGGVDNLPVSIGINGLKGLINAPTVFNSSLNFRQFWDGRAATLQAQVHGPIHNTLELGSHWAEVIHKLNQDQAIKQSFSKLYPGQGVSAETISDAIAHYETTLLTPDSRFDLFLKGQSERLSREERKGYQLFGELGCISCHQGVNIGGNMYQKMGTVNHYFIEEGNLKVIDFGRYQITKNVEHKFEFKVPGLRNIALTAPYFHDGSVETLEQAVDMMAYYQLGIHLEQDEIGYLVSFLKSLTGRYKGQPL